MLVIMERIILKLIGIQMDLMQPLHECMNTKIVYKDRIPLSGSHRPLWPVYGEYIYLPPQRWLHSLEHGAAVFLYHPCADKEQIELLKQLARNCLRKHIITPYNKLQRSRPFAIVTWGCRLTMERLTDDAVYDAVTFIKVVYIRCFIFITQCAYLGVLEIFKFFNCYQCF
ncbi:hypothetical protein KUTeg_009712 [Tegillarca granosa]|uniref:Uncharacterized protein n=1 Tax=Tegillarca granosa TaxID=220873 RepID=A0ABQ9F4N9_TEGGR|nr:hypothetical protein KUTeg_009712 [Tegillarca granosa]